jgi:hypothetical protein
MSPFAFSNVRAHHSKKIIVPKSDEGGRDEYQNAIGIAFIYAPATMQDRFVPRRVALHVKLCEFAIRELTQGRRSCKAGYHALLSSPSMV